jgi:small-conductance mechanosensitive channel
VEALHPLRLWSKVHQRTIVLIVIVLAVAALLVFYTTTLDDPIWFGFFHARAAHVIAIEVALTSILVTELAGHDLQAYFKARDRLTTGVAIRTVVRAGAYLVLMVAVVSMLAANPALAVGVGSVTGLVIGFAAQNTLGNALAGVILSLSRPFSIGDEITVMGSTGRVVELRLMYTIMDAEHQMVIIPSSVLMTQVILRRKTNGDLEAREDADHTGV